MVEGQKAIMIKKETMIKKNTHDINDVYNFEKGVQLTLLNLIRNSEADRTEWCTKQCISWRVMKELLKLLQEAR